MISIDPETALIFTHVILTLAVVSCLYCFYRLFKLSKFYIRIKKWINE